MVALRCPAHSRLVTKGPWLPGPRHRGHVPHLPPSPFRPPPSPLPLLSPPPSSARLPVFVGKVLQRLFPHVPRGQETRALSTPASENPAEGEKAAAEEGRCGRSPPPTGKGREAARHRRFCRTACPPGEPGLGASPLLAAAAARSRSARARGADVPRSAAAAGPGALCAGPVLGCGPLVRSGLRARPLRRTRATPRLPSLCPTHWPVELRAPGRAPGVSPASACGRKGPGGGTAPAWRGSAPRPGPPLQ